MAEFPFCCAEILGGTCFENSRTAVGNRQLDENRFLALRWNLWDDYTDALQRATPGAHLLESCRIENFIERFQGAQQHGARSLIFYGRVTRLSSHPSFLFVLFELFFRIIFTQFKHAGTKSVIG